MAKEEIIEKGYVKKFKTLFKNPSKFFKSVEKDKGYRKIMLFYVVIATVSVILGAILNILQIIFKPETLQSSIPLSVFYLIGGILLGIIFTFITPFIGAAITHLGVLIFRGKEGFFNTYKPATYSSAVMQFYRILISIISIPLLFLTPIVDYNSIPQDQLMDLLLANNWVMFGLIISIVISLISLVHSYVILIIGIAKFQKMTKLRAFFSAIIIPLIMLVIALILIGILVAYLITTGTASSIPVA